MSVLFRSDSSVGGDEPKVERLGVMRTDGTNPVPSRGESVSLPELLSSVENLGFPRGCAGCLGDRIGRDAGYLEPRMLNLYGRITV